MAKEEFEDLQSGHLQSGKTIKSFLSDKRLSYSTCNYWKTKFTASENKCEPAPIEIRQKEASSPSFSCGLPSGATLLLPNGLRAYFGSGTEENLVELLNKSLGSHVLP